MVIKAALSQQERKMPEKYINIETSLKILNNLINEFRKKAENYET